MSNSDQIRLDFNVPAAMRDGVILRANIFRPADEGHYPVLLVRTPYGKDFSAINTTHDALRLARAGYIVVIQDTRGRFNSEGEFAPMLAEAADGYDSVEWAARLPGSTGSVGMMGASYLGFTQWTAASQQPPHLKAIMPSITWANSRDGLHWRGGALELGLIANWLLSVGIDTLMKRVATLSPGQQQHVAGALINEIDHLRSEGYYALPLKEFAPLKRHDIAAESFFDAFVYPYDREYARSFSICDHYDRVAVPAYNIGGWYDIFAQGTLDNFRALRTGGSAPQVRQSKVLIGPWAHANLTGAVGAMDFGFAASASFINLQGDLTGLALRWFDYWLKGIDNGIVEEAPVRIFVMGENRWRDESEWPLARTEYRSLYLRADLALSWDAPGDESPDHYVYDPAAPTPVLGGAVLMSPLFGLGVSDQRPMAERSDTLAYISPPLDHDLEVTGPVVVKLWAASDGRDTDFVARLIDVFPDGFAQNLADGIIRARYRNGDQPEWMEPGRPYEFTIDLWATANVFKAGHRIRLDIASACFPRWDRNPNTGEELGVSTALRPAHQTILHDGEHPSHVILPVIPG